MKRRILLFTLMIATLGATQFGCQTEDLIGTFTANIGGTQWTATAPGAVKTGTRLTITGIGDSKSIILQINGTTAGTYDMNVFSTNIQPFTYTPNTSAPQDTYLGTSGSIVVSSVQNNRISGTFSVVATNLSSQTISITGSFTNVIYV